jgi:hypothetical protein
LLPLGVPIALPGLTTSPVDRTHSEFESRPRPLRPRERQSLSLEDRVNENHFVRISNAAVGTPEPVVTFRNRTTLLSKLLRRPGNRAHKPSGAHFDCPSI